MQSILKALIITCAIPVTAGAQERALLFNTAILSHPQNYAATQITFTPEEYSGRIVWQTELGWRRPLKGELWHTEFLISYRQSSASMSGPGRVPNEQASHYQSYVYGQIETSNKLYMPGAKFGVSKKWKVGKNESAFWLTIGAQEHAIFFSSKTRVIPDGVHAKPYSTEDSFDFKQLIFGFYSRPMFEFYLGKNADTWKFIIFTEVNFLQHNRHFKNGSIIYGGGLGIRYEL
ncbi:hypothetical protein [Owenweeksia hongkongensis]|uniref:hypothetical protein n=1 Tax=Owenweeksia hongkongensis TaxID=253245 RepID=UPI003A8E9FDA